MKSSSSRTHCRYTNIYSIDEIQWSHKSENVCIVPKRYQRHNDWKENKQVVNTTRSHLSCSVLFVIFLLCYVFPGACLWFHLEASWIVFEKISDSPTAFIGTYSLCQSWSCNTTLMIWLTVKSGFKRKSDLEKWCHEAWFSLAEMFSTHYPLPEVSPTLRGLLWPPYLRMHTLFL